MNEIAITKQSMTALWEELYGNHTILGGSVLWVHDCMYIQNILHERQIHSNMLVNFPKKRSGFHSKEKERSNY